jgi:hypothetical protein
LLGSGLQDTRSTISKAETATLTKLLLQPLLAALVLPFFVDLESVAGRVALGKGSLFAAGVTH